jgi:hypothetical protein
MPVSRVKKHLLDHINSLRGEALSHKTSLTRPFLLKCLYQDKKVSGKFVERGKNRYPSKQIHDHSLSCLGTGTSIKMAGLSYHSLNSRHSFTSEQGELFI